MNNESLKFVMEGSKCKSFRKCFFSLKVFHALVWSTIISPLIFLVMILGTREVQLCARGNLIGSGQYTKK